MVARKVVYSTIKVTQEHEICICMWSDLLHNCQEAVQEIGEDYIEPNLLFELDLTEPINGRECLIGFNEKEYDGWMTLNFNTYLSEN